MVYIGKLETHKKWPRDSDFTRFSCAFVLYGLLFADVFVFYNKLDNPIYKLEKRLKESILTVERSGGRGQNGLDSGTKKQAFVLTGAQLDCPSSELSLQLFSNQHRKMPLLHELHQRSATGPLLQARVLYLVKADFAEPGGIHEIFGWKKDATRLPDNPVISVGLTSSRGVLRREDIVQAENPLLG